jgi:outer membrane protein TolC
VLAVQRDLIDLARARQSLIEQRVDDGAAAAISIDENQENLLKREAGLIEAERDLVERAQSLSIFLRDADGRARVPRREELPSSLPELPDVELAGVDSTLAAVFARRPEAALIDNAIALEEQRLRLGENFMLPRLDVAYELRRDFGAGSPTREGTDNILGVRVEIPLENRLYEGRTAEAKANLQKLASERRLLEDRIRVEIEKLVNDIRAARALVTTTTAQVERAAIVAEGERERLAEGASQLFLVNLREEETADARVRLIAARFKREQSLADFFAATVQLEQFYPDGRVPLFVPPR